MRIPLVAASIPPPVTSSSPGQNVAWVTDEPPRMFAVSVVTLVSTPAQIAKPVMFREVVVVLPSTVHPFGPGRLGKLSFRVAFSVGPATTPPPPVASDPPSQATGWLV